MSSEIGTLRWFGESWGTSVNVAEAQVPVPVGASCENCRELMEETSEGVTVFCPPPGPPFVYHLTCWVRELAGVSSWTS